MRRSLIYVALIALSSLTCFTNVYAQTVAVGSGSYTTVLPPADAAGRNLDPKGTPRVSGNAITKPIATSDWWTGLLTFDNSNLYNYPMSLRAVSDGLVVSYTSLGMGADDTRQPMSGDQPLLIGVSGLAATYPTVSDYSDWTVTAAWTSGSRTLNATIGMGMPFVYFTKGTSDVASVTVSMGSVSVQNEMILVTNSLGGANFAVYAPAGSTWSQNGTTYTSTLAGKNYFSAAMLTAGVAASTGDFKVNVSSASSNPTLTFVPVLSGAGSGICILYYSTSLTATFPGYIVTPNTPYQITAPAGATVYFYYTYSTPSNGERSTVNSKNSFTVGSCSTLKAAVLETEIVQEEKGAFEIYPVPMKDVLNIEFEKDIYNSMTITNLQGNVVLKQPISSEENSLTLDVSQLMKGAYFLSLQGANARVGKLIVK